MAKCLFAPVSHVQFLLARNLSTKPAGASEVRSSIPIYTNNGYCMLLSGKAAQSMGGGSRIGHYITVVKESGLGILFYHLMLSTNGMQSRWVTQQHSWCLLGFSWGDAGVKNAVPIYLKCGRSAVQDPSTVWQSELSSLVPALANLLWNSYCENEIWHEVGSFKLSNSLACNVSFSHSL